MRSAWIEKRKGQANVSQMHYARQGVVTEEMAHVAKRENLPESLVMEEVARGRLIIPAMVMGQAAGIAEEKRGTGTARVARAIRDVAFHGIGSVYRHHDLVFWCCGEHSYV